MIKVVFLTSACGQDEIRKYRIPKDFLVPIEQSNLVSQWSAPRGWREKTSTSMRIKSFIVPDVDSELGGDFGLIVMPLAGNRLIDNINLWRSELKLKPIQLGEEERYFQEININKKPIFLVDFVSEELLVESLYPERTFVAFFPHGDKQYFFKLKGISSLVEKEKDRLLVTLEKIQFE